MKAVDLFAGAGGFSEGARRAGVHVVWAANHWRSAVDAHAANHPETEHACQDLHQADWSRVPKHDLLLASPACTGHTRARGKDRPGHDAARSTAWAVVSAAEVCRPEAVVVENVPELRAWALYPSWTDAMRRLGYSLSETVIDAAALGVPQHRERLFVVGTRSLAPLRLHLPRRAEVPARSILDLDGPARWSPIDRPGRAPATLRRIQEGRRQHGDEFLVAYYGSERGGRSLDRPLGTVTTRDRFAIVRGDQMRMLTVDESKAAMGFPSSYILPPDRRIALHLLGNAVCPPVAEAIIRSLLGSARAAA